MENANKSGKRTPKNPIKFGVNLNEEQNCIEAIARILSYGAKPTPEKEAAPEASAPESPAPETPAEEAPAEEAPAEETPTV
jgi:hypothetical protein